MNPSLSTPKRHLITIALEDYFQVGAFNRLIQRKQWYRFEPRLEHNTRKVLDLLDRFQVKATFFVLGWVADQYPELVRLVAEKGHEIASKGYYHRSVRGMTPTEFREDLARSREALERASGKRVVGYRVADGWFSPADLWALDVLAEEGYAYDSSINPLFRQFSDEPWRRFAHQHQFHGRELWEFPISTSSVLGMRIPIAGGNYFRQFPHFLVKRAVARWHRRHESPFVMYFHVWEVDPEQPQINAVSWLTSIRHYRNIAKMPWILEYYLKNYSFTSVADYLGLDTRLTTVPAPSVPNGTGEHSRSDDVQGEAPAATAVPPPTAPDGSSPRTPVSIVVPCYNEELILPYLANTLSSVQATLGQGYDIRFLFVDDCSQDLTLNALRKTFGPWPNATVLHHERNQGVAAAIKTGIDHASTEVVCSIDCDCTYDPHELGKMIPLLTDDVDMVTASPYHPDGQVRNVSGSRLVLSRTCSWLYRRVLRQKLFTYTSCFRVYRRSAMLDLNVRETGYLGIPEMLAQLDLRGSRIVEYPSTLEVRMLGRSKMKVVQTIFGHLRLLTRLLFQRWFGKQPEARAIATPAPAAAEVPEVPANPQEAK